MKQENRNNNRQKILTCALRKQCVQLIYYGIWTEMVTDKIFFFFKQLYHNTKLKLEWSILNFAGRRFGDLNRIRLLKSSDAFLSSDLRIPHNPIWHMMVEKSNFNKNRRENSNRELTLYFFNKQKPKDKITSVQTGKYLPKHRHSSSSKVFHVNRFLTT